LRPDFPPARTVPIFRPRPNWWANVGLLPSSAHCSRDVVDSGRSRPQFPGSPTGCWQRGSRNFKKPGSFRQPITLVRCTRLPNAGRTFDRFLLRSRLGTTGGVRRRDKWRRQSPPGAGCHSSDRFPSGSTRRRMPGSTSLTTKQTITTSQRWSTAYRWP
jgi:hypothetical protein